MKGLVLACSLVALLSAGQVQAACQGGTPNGVLNPGEQCDDNDLVDTNCCTNQCANPCVHSNPCKVFDHCTATNAGGHRCSFDDAPDGSLFCGAADGNPCTRDYCYNGACFRNFPSGTSCDDGNACTTGTTCSNSHCQGGTGTSCDDGHSCTADSCNPATGVCSNVLLGAGAACTDLDSCTGIAGNLDHCDGVQLDCIPGGALVCPASDGDPCTDDLACDPVEGCQNPLKARNAPCNANEPGGSDSNICTEDKCTDPGRNCTFSATPGAFCQTDSNACTVESCQYTSQSVIACTVSACMPTIFYCPICGTKCTNSLPLCGCDNS